MSATLSYLLAALAAAAASVVLLARVRRGDITRRAAVATGVTLCWALALASEAAFGALGAWVTFFAEGVRYLAWFAILHSFASASPHWLKRTTVGVAIAIVIYSLLGWLGQYTQTFTLPLAGFFATACLLLAFAGLVATEQALRHIPHAESRHMRWCTIGIGGQFAFDLFLFSQAQLLGGIDTAAWAMRGVVVAILLIPFAWGASRIPSTRSSVFVSRHVVFYSTTFVAVGLYLTLMALGGYYVRDRGGDWGNALQVVFLCGAVGILAVLLLAESPFRRLRVFIATHFYRNKYDYRIEWLRFVQTLSATDEPDVHRTAVRAVAQIFGSSGGLLMLRDEESDRYTLRSSWPESWEGQVECGALGAQDSLPRFLRARQWVIDLNEYRQRPQMYGDLEIPSWLGSAGPWRVVSPLLVGSELLGFLILRSPPEPFSMNFEDRDLLKTVGRNVAVQLAQHRADEKLAQSRQFDAYNRFAAFVMHDLKNSVAQLQLLVANASRHRNNPVFVDDAIGTIEHTAERMTRLIEQLQSRDMKGTERPVDMTAVARAAVARSGARTPAVGLQSDAGELPVNADPDRLGAVIDHVIRNAQDATPTGGTVALRLVAVGDEAHLHVIDEGSGMDAEFVRQRLFRPFDSTKGSKGMGIGAYQTREYARWLGGDVEVLSTPGKGTDFCIRLPLCQKKSRSS